jgi:hypothetical protein
MIPRVLCAAVILLCQLPTAHTRSMIASTCGYEGGRTTLQASHSNYQPLHWRIGTCRLEHASWCRIMVGKCKRPSMIAGHSRAGEKSTCHWARLVRLGSLASAVLTWSAVVERTAL